MDTLVLRLSPGEVRAGHGAEGGLAVQSELQVAYFLAPGRQQVLWREPAQACWSETAALPQRGRRA